MGAIPAPSTYAERIEQFNRASHSDPLREMQGAVAMQDMFEAWVVGARNSRRIDLTGADCLTAARDRAASAGGHKAHFLVKHTDRISGDATVHVFYVKQKAAIWIKDPETGVPKQIRPLEAELRFSMPVNAFAPVEPWRWSPGCDVVGLASTPLAQAEGRDA